MRNRSNKNFEGVTDGVLKIHETKKEKGKTLYLVEWEGCPEQEEYTWEMYTTLKNSDVFKQFISRSKKKETKNKGTKRKRNEIIVKNIFKKTKRETLSKDERFEIVQNQNYKCNLCINPFGSVTFEIDHIIPLEQGGTNNLDNLQALCESCHIFKTSVLDRGVVARLLQAKLQCQKVGSDHKLTRKRILEECQLVYFNRNRNKVPFHENEMLNFCIETADIYREMCKKEVKKRLADIIKMTDININNSNVDITMTSDNDIGNANPPEPPQSEENQDRNDKYLNGVVAILQNAIELKLQTNIIKMEKFSIVFDFIFPGEIPSNNEMYDYLNEFFKKIYMRQLKELKETYKCITISFTRN